MHRLKVVVNGTNHQISVDGVLLINATDGTYTASGYLGLRAYNGTGATIAAGMFDNVGVVAALSGTWQSPAISLTSATTYGSSVVFWDTAGIPDSTCSITGQTSIDGGSTFQPVTNGGAISGLTAGTSLSGKTLILLLTLTASNAPVVPTMNGVTAWVQQQYSSSGTWTNAPLANDTFNRANQSGLGTTTDGQAYTQIGTGTVAISSNTGTITNTTGDVHMLPGSKTAGDEQAVTRFQISAATISAGLELRYVDANNFYRLKATQNSLIITSVITNVTRTLASATPTLALNTWYRMRFAVVGDGPINFYGRVWADNATEPATWNVTATF
jgi:hypothetical protein